MPKDMEMAKPIGSRALDFLKGVEWDY
jgi:hypothetical protein